ncbi:MAG: MATE family efflux transporter [Eubacteriales bacterium]|nr:MATE family efflux transporter [Eubacteriales bacterium]
MSAENVYKKPITLKNVMSFALPTIVMSVFMSFYTMVDGLFVSNLIGTNALSAINFTAPVISVVSAISTMLATGGSAVIMKKIGEEKIKEANEDFTFLIIVNVVIGIFMWLFGYLIMDMIFRKMNLSAEVFDYCHVYLSRYLLFTVPILLMNNFTIYMIAAGKSALSMSCSIAGGILNIILDYVFIEIFNLGIAGATIATGLGYSVTAVTGLIIFSRKNSLLHFVRPVYRMKTLINSATNGSSEMATALVTGIVTMMYNWTMLKYVGEDGVAAITIIMYVLMFATSLYTGYTYGVAPMISFYYGEQNHYKLKKLIRMSLKIVGIVGVATLILSIILTEPLVAIFTRPDNPVYELAVAGNRICSTALIFIGINIFASGMFTALSNGLISAILAFSRSFVFMVIATLLLPILFGVTGVWLATPVAEFASICLSIIMLVKYRNKYCY